MKFVLPLILALSLPDGLSVDDAVELEQGVAFLGVELPEQVAPGESIVLDLYFTVEAPLPDEVLSFVHVESQSSDCPRLVRDRRPTDYDGPLLHHRVEIPVPDDGRCRPGQRLEIFHGLYNRLSNERYRVSDATTDDRLYGGAVDLVAQTTGAERRVLSASDLRRQRWLNLLHPWRGWLFGVAGSLALLLLLRWLLRRRRGRETRDGTAVGLAPVGTPLRSRRLRLLGVLPVVALLMTSIVVAIDFVKDDAYISFRYAHNLATGHGLVFNPGERVEGFTNFLWVLVMAPFEALGLDLFQVCEILGSALAIALVFQLTALSVHFQGAWRHHAHLWGAVWLASSSSLGLWATSGMEQPLAMLLPLSSAYFLWTASAREPVPARRCLFSGVLMGLGCMTRPEIHLIGILVGLPLVVRALLRRRIEPATWAWFAGLLAITVPFHLFRYLYFGSLVPNTFYVKTGDSVLIMIAGLSKLREMFDFNHIGILLLLAPLAFLDRRHRTEKLVMLAISLGFMAYVVKVGRDEMRWHRLYLPALPFLVLLAAMGLQSLIRGLVQLSRVKVARILLVPVGWAAVLLAAGSNFDFTYDEMGGFNGRGDLSGTYHPDIGKFLTRHERPGGLVAFQDMGSTPYHAPDIDFLDFIGLVDATVARARYDYGLNAFVATEAHHNQAEYDAEMREYFYERNPEWVILTTYIPGQQAGTIAERFLQDPVPESLGGYVERNGYQFGIYDRTFRERYVHVRTWPRSVTYYLSLFRRRDLWEQIPGEVVLDAVPEGLGGVRARFEGGLELLGSEMESEAVERHEAFVTTWWRTPGPMPADINFFIHVEREGYRAPFDHIPGDFMYPADRWRPGDIIENRYLLQIPVHMTPGTYRVFMGVYRRSTGERLAIVDGPNDGANRLLLGTLEVRPMRPLLDHLIPPTDIDEQRKYPERIVDPNG